MNRRPQISWESTPDGTKKQRPRNRWDIPPADMARILDREQTKFKENIMINPSPWTIAKVLRNVFADNQCEGLRGVFINKGEGDQSLIWWVAYRASHMQGRNMLGIEISNDIMEVEINIDADGTLYACWERDHSQEEAFLGHQTMQNMVDGCLAVQGKKLAMRNGQIRFAGPGVDIQKEIQDDRLKMAAIWPQLLKQTRSWSSMKRTHLPDGRPVPQKSVITSYRSYLKTNDRFYTCFIIPLVTIEENGSIVLTWKKTGSIATITFKEDGAYLYKNEDGKISESGPHFWKKERDVDLFRFTYDMSGYRSEHFHSDYDHIKPQKPGKEPL